MLEQLGQPPSAWKRSSPLALKGVRNRAIGATDLLRHNLLIYGLGGMILPFIGIKLIDLIVHNLLGA